MSNLKRFFLLLFCTLSILGFAEEEDIEATETALEQITSEHRDAVNKALHYLATQQNLKQGYWTGGVPKGGASSSSLGLEDLNLSAGENTKFAIATTSFACLAYLANGHIPGYGEYGNRIAMGLRYILNQVGEGGYIGNHSDESRMHGHGYATLFLAEVYGMANEKIYIRDEKDKNGKIQLFTLERVITNDEIREKLKKALNLIQKSQTKSGGWGYEASSVEDDHEGSITVCQLQALRAARNSGITIDKAVIDRAFSYLRKSAKKNGSFKYRLHDSTSKDSFPLTAAAISTFHAIGDYNSEEVRRGLDFLNNYWPPKRSHIQDRFYNAFWCYGQLYAAQAFYHSVDEKDWNRWFYHKSGIRNLLLS
jgi:hypothetical protein